MAIPCLGQIEMYMGKSFEDIVASKYIAKSELKHGKETLKYEGALNHDEIIFTVIKANSTGLIDPPAFSEYEIEAHFNGNHDNFRYFESPHLEWEVSKHGSINITWSPVMNMETKEVIHGIKYTVYRATTNPQALYSVCGIRANEVPVFLDDIEETFLEVRPLESETDTFVVYA